MNELERSLKESFVTVCIINLILKINNKYLIGIEY